MTLTKRDKIIYICDTEEDYNSLMEYLEDRGVIWVSKQKPTRLYNWIPNRIYMVQDLNITWGYRSDLERRDKELQSFETVYWKGYPEPEPENQSPLAKFLGWKDDTIYKDGVYLYKIKDGELYGKYKQDRKWGRDTSVPLNSCFVLRQLREYNPRYMIKSHFYSNEGVQYLSKRGRFVFFATELQNKDLQIFSKEEAEELIKEHKLEDIVELVDIQEPEYQS